MQDPGRDQYEDRDRHQGRAHYGGAGAYPPGYGDYGSHPGGSLMPLRRVRNGRVLAGVAGGLAEYLEIDVTLVRIGFALLALVGGIALPAYLACWLLIPEEGAEGTLADDLLYRAGDFFDQAETRLSGRAR